MASLTEQRATIGLAREIILGRCEPWDRTDRETIARTLTEAQATIARMETQLDALASRQGSAR